MHFSRLRAEVETQKAADVYETSAAGGNTREVTSYAAESFYHGCERGSIPPVR